MTSEATFYHRAHSRASLRQVHDAVLGCGSLPPRLMRRRLLES